MMSDVDDAARKLRVLVIGAHPDDADFHAGGVAALYREFGAVVKMVSLTDGGAGHHLHPGAELVRRRRGEATAAASVIGATYDVFDIPDGELLPTLENRWAVITLIRTFEPDLVLTHRPNDYHPDHRYTSQLVQDAAYMVTVPAVVPNVPYLRRDPVIAYLPDDFRKPVAFEATVAVDVGPVLDKIVAMLDCHVSQFYEWLPHNGKHIDEVPDDERERRDWLAGHVRERLAEQAHRFRAALVRGYGEERGGKVEFAEGFEGCEYGSPLDEHAIRRLFPFVQEQ
ncbi:MAG: PIG-L deacetylase family protein [Gemmataceae bacterium]